MKRLEISTDKKYQLVDITNEVSKVASELKSGIISVFTTHTTAAIIITEDEPNLRKDWLSVLESEFKGREFLHDKLDNNAKSHILGGLLGPEEVIIVDDGLVLGTWQSVFLVELDGPRNRNVVIKSIKDD